MKRIVFLDWLRIFSFLSVLVGHKFYNQLYAYAHDDSIHASLRFILELTLPLCSAGGAGVVVFFLVSGYVIAHVLQTEAPLEFYIKRVFRIYPLYVFAVLFQYALIVLIDHGRVHSRILIPQLLLMGDLFDTPYTLNGVEWTLRVEVLFYFFMLLMRHFKFIGEKERFLPYILILTTVAMGCVMPLVPNPSFANQGYLNIYGPFLFLGTFIWLYEHQRVTLALTSLFVGLVFIQHWHLIDIYLPDWRYAHFSVLAFLLFLTAWNFQDKLFFNRLILFVSELTYAVYLLHNWLFERIKQWSIMGGLFQHNLYALLMLFAISALLVVTIEKPAIKLGRKLISYLRTNAPALVGSKS